MDMAEQNVGKVVQVIGPVLDVEFDPERMPELYNALRIDEPGNGKPPVHLVAEVQQHVGRNQVRAVAMSSSDGVVRGMSVTDTGGPVTGPGGGGAAGGGPNVDRGGGGGGGWGGGGGGGGGGPPQTGGGGGGGGGPRRSPPAWSAGPSIGRRRCSC